MANVQTWPAAAADEPQVEIIFVDPSETLHTVNIGVFTRPTEYMPVSVATQMIMSRAILEMGDWRVAGIRFPIVGKFSVFSFGGNNIQVSAADMQLAYYEYLTYRSKPQSVVAARFKLIFLSSGAVLCGVDSAVDMLAVALLYPGSNVITTAYVQYDVSCSIAGVS